MRRSLQLSLKRALDICAALLGLIVLSPFFIVIAIAIALDSRGPILFSQDRVGLRGKQFRIFKFRTMVENAEHTGTGLYVSHDDARITRVGKMLRRFSLDELPQVWNVFRGEMSLVGPRPALPYHIDHYSSNQRRRLSVRPGLTGWSQVNGRNRLTWPERLEKDVWYVDHFSLWLDARILARTPAAWLSSKGLYAARENFSFSGHDDIPSPSKRKP